MPCCNISALCSALGRGKVPVEPCNNVGYICVHACACMLACMHCASTAKQTYINASCMHAYNAPANLDACNKQADIHAAKQELDMHNVAYACNKEADMQYYSKHTCIRLHERNEESDMCACNKQTVKQTCMHAMSKQICTPKRCKQSASGVIRK